MQGAYQDCLEVIEKAKQLDPNSVQWYLLTSICLNQLGYTQAATRLFAVIEAQIRQVVDKSGIGSSHLIHVC